MAELFDLRRRLNLPLPAVIMSTVVCEWTTEMLEKSLRRRARLQRARDQLQLSLVSHKRSGPGLRAPSAKRIRSEVEWRMAWLALEES